MNSKPIQIRLPGQWHDAVRKQAERDGVSSSEWIRDAIYGKLPIRISKQLPIVKLGRPREEK
jgi:predicted HicB family RNase H-like nuclease